jgi:hypothetical protein
MMSGSCFSTYFFESGNPKMQNVVNQVRISIKRYLYSGSLIILSNLIKVFMKKFKIVFSLFLITFSNLLVAQNPYDYGFEKIFSINVTDSNGKILTMPWVGGLNSVQFSEIDLNHDGIKDLFAFEKSGSNIYTFINQGITDSVSYVYDYRYEKYFPKCYGWAFLKDYNFDGKEDLFTYTSAGIKVFKNISDTIPQFQMLYPMLNTDIGQFSTNIGLTEDDYPAIGDIDGDGDLDILNFFGLGTYLLYQKNLSQELYGNADTLVFEQACNCWGAVAENSGNNQVFLNVNCLWKGMDFIKDKATRHVGSTMLLYNFNNDSLMDLVLGDVDYFNLTLLINGGTKDSAHIVAKDTLFPDSVNPIAINSFPVLSLLDVNNDGKKDLLASPFTSIYTNPENKNSIWHYQNTGTQQLPVFTKNLENFLQNEMIDMGGGSYPVIVDLDNDGLEDIVAGNYGYLDSSYYEFGSLKAKMRSQLTFFKNTGSINNPAFAVENYDFANLSNLKLVDLTPTFGDVDNDSDLDMICGNSDGTLLYFQNSVAPGNIPVFVAPITSYQGIDVGAFSHPQLFDLNGDNLLDLVVGNQVGKLSYYQNTGTSTNPVYSLITDSLGGVNTKNYLVNSYGYSRPCFFKDSGDIKLFVGSYSGDVYYYKNIAGNIAGKFTCEDTLLTFLHPDSSLMTINDGIYSGVAAHDFNGDGYMDMVLGNFSGGFTYYKGILPEGYVGIDESTPVEVSEISLFPNPALSKFSIGFSKQTPNSGQMILTDICGRQIAHKIIFSPNDWYMNIDKIPAGIYQCTLIFGNENANTRITKKVVVIK